MGAFALLSNLKDLSAALRTAKLPKQFISLKGAKQPKNSFASLQAKKLAQKFLCRPLGHKTISSQSFRQ